MCARANRMTAQKQIPQILFYLGYDNDRGGICSFLRALATASAPHFEMMLGMNPGARFAQPAPPVIEFPAIAGETISPVAFLRARTIARAVREWLRADPRRIFHGCSRAGLLIALWLAHWDEKRAVATVHCYGRRRWFYRHAARTLAPGKRLFFLSPQMSRYYGLPPQSWDECLPPCIEGRGRLPGASQIQGNMHGDPAAPALIRAAGIGALVRWKGWHLVLEALAQLPPDIRGRWCFTHIGGTDGTVESERYAARLRARTSALGLDGQVRWLGQQPSSAQILGESDVLLTPSDHESFSVARLEALARGVPSVSADTGGALDLITATTPPQNGWLFRNGDASDLARVLAKLSAPGALAGVHIDRDGLSRFFAGQCAARHARIYAGLLDTNR